jgi:aspartyl/asparaginyl-tRNA synthetase
MAGFVIFIYGYNAITYCYFIGIVFSAMSRVYTLAQTFRAEKSMSPKHLSEFLMFEVEESFVESLDDIMDRVETVCKFISYYLSQNSSDDLNIVLKKTNYKYFDNIANSKYIRY